MVYFPQERMTDKQRYHSGLMSDVERRAYETHLASQQFAAQEEEETRATEMAQADIDWAAKQEMTPEQAAAEQYKARTGRYPTSYAPEPALLDPNVPYTAPVPTAVPTTPPEAPPPDDPTGIDVPLELEALRAKYEPKFGGAERGLQRATSKIGGIDSEVAQARKNLGRVEGVLNTSMEKLANFEINPQRAFPNAFSKIAAVISVAMGAYAQGLSGGKLPNTALKIIQGAIKTDIDAQKMEFHKLKGLVDEKRNVYGMAMRLLGNEQQAEDLAYTVAYRAYKAETDRYTQQYGLDLKGLGITEEAQWHENSLKYKAIGGGAKDDAERATLRSLRSQIGGFRELWNDKGFEDVFGGTSVAQAFMETHGGKIEQKRGLIARQLLMYTDKGRISDKDFEIMLKFIPGVWKSRAMGHAMLDGLEEMIGQIATARWGGLSDEARTAEITAKAQQLGGDILGATPKDGTYKYWKGQQGTQVTGKK
jgi:hypothetical protein